MEDGILWTSPYNSAAGMGHGGYGGDVRNAMVGEVQVAGGGGACLRVRKCIERQRFVSSSTTLPGRGSEDERHIERSAYLYILQRASPPTPTFIR